MTVCQAGLCFELPLNTVVQWPSYHGVEGLEETMRIIACWHFVGAEFFG